MNRTPVTLILLAAGDSTRFGRDKLSYAINGEPMLSRSIRLYAKSGIRSMIGRRILVTQPSQTEFIREAEAEGYEIALNPNPRLGISESIRIGLRRAGTDDTEGFLFSVADQPYLTEETVERILKRFTEDPSRIVVPAAAGRTGNPVVFPAAFYGELCSLSGDAGGKQVITRHPERVASVETEEHEMDDIDLKSEVTV